MDLQQDLNLDNYPYRDLGKRRRVLGGFAVSLSEVAGGYCPEP